MYNEYFGFAAPPFSIAPDPRYLFMSARHREALAHLLYGLRIDGGFVLLTGEVGTGKTTICRCLLEQVPDDCDVAFILNPRLDTLELLCTLCDELHIAVHPGERTIKVLVDQINRHLLDTHARGRRTVMIIDEAQNLSNDVLEQLRLLTNLETSERKLLQILLLGQPELRERLARPEMRQLSQRIVARYHLEPLSRREVFAYVEHRIAVAGGRHKLFAPEALDRLFRLSKGTPRLINLVCDRALLGAYAEGRTVVKRATLDRAAREVLGEEAPSGALRRGLFAGLVAAGLAGGAAVAWQHLPPSAAPSLAASGTEVAPTIARSATPAPPTPSGGDNATAPVHTLRWPNPDEHWLHEVMAVRRLFAQWGVEMPLATIDDACRLAAQHELACEQGSGTLDDLIAMNVPAMLRLTPAEGPAFFATLQGLAPGGAQLAFAGTTQEISAENLVRDWSGDYLVLRRAVPDWYRVVGNGMRGKDVAWVNRQLDRWEGRTAANTTVNAYDASTEARLRAFQRAQGLREDGVVGPITLVRLAAVADSSSPALARAGE